MDMKISDMNHLNTNDDQIHYPSMLEIFGSKCAVFAFSTAVSARRYSKCEHNHPKNGLCSLSLINLVSMQCQWGIIFLKMEPKIYTTNK